MQPTLLRQVIDARAQIVRFNRCEIYRYLRLLSDAAKSSKGHPAVADLEEASSLVYGFFENPDDDVRAWACDTLVDVVTSHREVAKVANLVRMAIVNLFALLNSSSSAVRLVALGAIERIPWWPCANSMVRAIRIPVFRQANCDKGDSDQAREGKEMPLERWHGAVFWALDDESTAVRCAVLRFFQTVSTRPEMVGENMPRMYQRLASLALVCVLDACAEVRRAAVDTLALMFAERKLKFVEPFTYRVRDYKSKDFLTLDYVLLALKVDLPLALEVLSFARFENERALAVAITSLVDLPCQAGVTDTDVINILTTMAAKNANLFRPVGGCPERSASKEERCQGLAHCLSRQCEQIVANSGIVAECGDLGVGVLLVNSTTLLRLRALLRATLAEVPSLRMCVHGLDLPPEPSLCDGDVFSASVALWAQSLNDCYSQIADLFCQQQHPQGSTEFKKTAIGARNALLQLRKECVAAAGPVTDLEAPSLSGNASAIATWAELLLVIQELWSESKPRPLVKRLRPMSKGPATSPVSSSRILWPPRAVASSLSSRMHVLVSRLAHGYSWTGLSTASPTTLLSFRLLAFRLMAEDTSLIGVYESIVARLGATAESAKTALEKGPGTYLPRLPKEHLPALVGPSSLILRRTSKIISVSERRDPARSATWFESIPVQLKAKLGSELIVTALVTANVPIEAVRLRTHCPVLFPARGTLWQLSPAETQSGLPPSEGGAASVRVLSCVLPLAAPADARCAVAELRLQLVLLLSGCTTGLDSVFESNKCLADSDHQGLQELEIGQAASLVLRLPEADEEMNPMPADDL